MHFSVQSGKRNLGAGTHRIRHGERQRQRDGQRQTESESETEIETYTLGLGDVAAQPQTSKTAHCKQSAFVQSFLYSKHACTEGIQIKFGGATASAAWTGPGSVGLGQAWLGLVGLGPAWLWLWLLFKISYKEFVKRRLSR